MRRRRIVDVKLPEPVETPEAQRDAIVWLIRKAIRLGDTRPAENCIALAYDINEEIAANEIARRRRAKEKQ